MQKVDANILILHDKNTLFAKKEQPRQLFQDHEKKTARHGAKRQTAPPTKQQPDTTRALKSKNTEKRKRICPIQKNQLPL
jgi:hypothetical protein